MLVDTFSHVELLNLEFLQIERIEHNALANGRNIKELFLSYNNIASLDQGVFDNLITLKAFTMDGNKLASIPNELFKNAKNLKTLSLASNNLQRIGDDSFLHHNQLESVNVTNNQLFHFDLSRIRNLFEADVSHNKLEKLELPSFVEYLDASHNEIKEVIGKIGNNLKDLMLSHNNLSTTAWLKSFTKLVTLDLSHNGIEDITSGDFHQLKQLTKLKLNNNRLFTFDIKDKEIMTSLQILDLSHNELIFVESNYKQFKILHELYLHHNSIVSLKQGQSVAWSKLEKLTLSENDWDCAKMEEFLAMLPPSVAVDYSSEAHCNHASLPQGLCCTRVEMAYHDRLIKKIAEISSYEKVIRASGRCNAGSLTNSVQNVSSIVTQPGALPSSDLAREVQQLQTEVQRIGGDVTEAESYVTSNINKIDTLTRIYRVVKTGLVLPSDTLRKVLDHLEQRDEFKRKETEVRYAEARAKENESENMKKNNELSQNNLEMKRTRTSELTKEKADVVKAIKKLEKEINRNPNARRTVK
ncbi:P-granule-associated novel protein 1-like [Anopheles coustani]|uniref:P-granule-associated novel protein 1-like n=1 Tax=Anopheles coustani TaxID=139045 RepID=UPI00265B1EB6|nr:P-granule-associated novel protein 1-like [Anopheles coustani]